MALLLAEFRKSVFVFCSLKILIHNLATWKEVSSRPSSTASRMESLPLLIANGRITERIALIANAKPGAEILIISGFIG